MALEGRRLLGCPHCGFRIGPTDRVCSRCGDKFSGTTRFECPFCGELVPRDSRSCPSCHVDYHEFHAKSMAKTSDESIDSLLMEIIKLEAMQIRAEDKRFSCPRCSWMLDGSELSCPKCGAALSDEVSFQCPVCGTMVSSEATSCPECGASFVTEEVEAAPAKKTVETVPTASDIGEMLAATGLEPERVADQPEVMPEPAPQPPPPAAEPEPVAAQEPQPEPPSEPAARKPSKQRKLKARTAPKRV